MPDSSRDLEFVLEQKLQNVYYLGPLRAFPERVYTWSGGQPLDMGEAGEYVVDALLAARQQDLKISPRLQEVAPSLGAIYRPAAEETRPNSRLSRRARGRGQSPFRGKGTKVL